MGSRKVKFKGRIHIVDRKNDLVAEVVIDPDSRGFFKKITSKKETYPDYFQYIYYLILVELLLIYQKMQKLEKKKFQSKVSIKKLFRKSKVKSLLNAKLTMKLILHIIPIISQLSEDKQTHFHLTQH